MSKIRVGIIADILQVPMSGMGRYILNVIRYLPSEVFEVVLITRTDGQVLLLPDLVKEHSILEKSRQKTARYRYLLRCLLRHPRQVDHLGLDVVHCPTQGVPPYFWFLKTPKVITIHGAAAFVLPRHLHRPPAPRQFLPFRLFGSRVAHFITVSESAKFNIIRHYRIPAAKITSVYHGVDHAQFYPSKDPASLTEALRVRLGIEYPYILHVSNYQPKKNAVAIVKAFSLLRKRTNLPHRLVLAGGEYYGLGEVMHLIDRDANLNDFVLRLGHLDGADLRLLYQGAAVFVFPSFHESFGLPLLEAMGCGVPVVTSNVFAIPEVVGEAALMVDPMDVEAMVAISYPKQ